MQRMELLKKAIRILLIVAAVLVAGAILLGVLNAVVADGKWSFGWTDYTYDESGFTVGDGTVAADRPTAIDIDWIDGTVEVVACDDTYISLTEYVPDGELSEGNRLRYAVDGDGCLQIKYRKSSFFLGSSQMADKVLTVRIPRRFLADLILTVNGSAVTVILNDVDMESLEMNTDSGNLAVLSGSTLEEVKAKTDSGKILISGVVKKVDLYTRSGEITLETLPQKAEIENERGDVRFKLSQAASFALDFETEKGRYVSEFSLSDYNGYLVCGGGDAELSVKVTEGVLYLVSYK